MVEQQKNEPVQKVVSVSLKNPALASVLSLLIVGLGQVYNGELAKGALMFVLAILGAFFTFGIATIGILIWSMVDAYQSAQRFNEHHSSTSAK